MSLLCGIPGFCGKFPAEHQVDLDYDIEPLNDKSKSKYQHMVAPPKQKKWTVAGVCRCIFFPPKKVDANNNSQAAGFLWRQYVRPDTVLMKSGKGQETQARVKRVESSGCSLGSRYPHMMSCINELGPVYSVVLDQEELQHIPTNLSQIETLCVLELPRNRIRQFTKELGSCKSLERIVLDWNLIDLMDSGIWSAESFGSLEVLSIAHNKAKFCTLPPDFGRTRLPNRLKHIDLHDNNISDVPETILECENLEFLDMSHNKIKKLPSQLGKRCSKLKKLFMSSNPLTELPDTIGECWRLHHIRVIQCQLRVLPDSILKLWMHPDYGGKLERLEVAKNPLVLPSITAFEMGGDSLDRAFGLLAAAVRHKTQHKHRVRPAITHQPVPGDTAKMIEAVKGSNEMPAPQLLNAQIPGFDYYFKHCAGNKHEINEIRNAESTLLIIKTNTYFENTRRMALKRAEKLGDGNVPASLKRFLDPNFTVSQWHEPVRVTDLDLYFNLLVYSTKPMFSSCEILFDRFETEDKGYLNREEWEELCLTVPVLLEDPNVKNQMWNLMSWQKSDRIFLKDFIAAWHVHDVEQPDPWIKAMTQVLRLEYYDMTIEELRDRLKAKDAEDATPKLNFDADPNEEQEEGAGDDGDSDDDKKHRAGREQVEGERWIVKSTNPTRSQKKGNSGIGDASHLANLISLSDAQYAQYEQQDGENDENKSDSDNSMKSDQLSEAGESSEDEEDEFSMLLAQQSVGAVFREDNGGGQFNVDSDAAVDKLMNMDPKAFFATKEQAEMSFMKAPAARKSTKKSRGKKVPSHDNHFRTDVFQVRQEIRQVYRNLPHDDFVKLISFLLRGMQQIAHSRVGTITYWHADDPTFKFTMGELCTNAYTRKLLATMGFAFLTDLLYWVWPDKHMSEVSKIAAKKIPVWGAEEIPKSCQGLNEDRLNDMILLLKRCQKALHKKGRKQFNGNFS